MGDWDIATPSTTAPAPVNNDPWAVVTNGAPGSDWASAYTKVPSWDDAAKQMAKDNAVDVAKTALPSLARGGIMVATTPRTVSDLTGAGVNWAAGKIAPQPVADAVKSFHEADTGLGKAFPSYDETKKGVEELTGPLHEAHTPIGRFAQTGLEIAPGLLAGGEGALPTLTKSIGAATGSALLGGAVDAFSGSLPAWAPGVAHGVGALVGTGLPGLARRVATPLPMIDERLATVNALKSSNPELVNATEAGQLTGYPAISALSARSPRMADLPQRQGAAYTQGVMRQAGSDGLFNDADLAAAKARGGELQNLQNQYQINSTEFGKLNSDVAAMGAPGSKLFKEVGPSEAFKKAQDAVALGPDPTGVATPSNMTGPPLSMTGERYGALKQILQGLGDNAPTTHEAQAIWAIRDRMKDAFKNSVPPDVAARVSDLDKQYANYSAIKDINNVSGGAIKDTVTPSQVYSAAPPNSQLREHATQASDIMQPLPKPNRDPGVLTKALGGAAGYALGQNEPVFGAYFGSHAIPDIVQALKDQVGKATASPSVQGYLKNQNFRPGNPAFTNDRATMARLLLTLPAQQAVSGGNP